jgi:hypothetical protein
LERLGVKEMHLYAPLCERHESHWRKRKLAARLGIFGLIAGGAFLVGSVDSADLVGLVAGGSFLVGSVALLGVARFTAIRPMEITDRSMALAGVCQAFVDAVERAREGSPRSEVSQVEE